jgi:hypothetical protein
MFSTVTEKQSVTLRRYRLERHGLGEALCRFGGEWPRADLFENLVNYIIYQTIWQLSTTDSKKHF